MKYRILTWEEFLKKIYELTGKDLEIVEGTEIHRGPVHSIAYSLERRIVITLSWAARMSEERKNTWSMMEEDTEYHAEFLAIGMQIIEWENGRLTLDNPRSPLACTYTFLTKEPNLNPLKAWE